MNREDIIRMARESNLMSVKFSTALEEMWVGQLERFANLVAAEERDACAKLVDYWEARQGEHSEAIRARGQHD